MSVHLIGGGRDGEAGAALLRPFVDEVLAVAGPTPVIAMLLVLEADDTTGADRFGDLLAAAGAPAGSIRPLLVIEGQKLAPEALDGIDGLFVGGGLTPAYLDAVRGAAAGVRERVDAGMPYAGFSAGAAIAPTQALVGGYRIDGASVCPQDAGEELEEVEVRPGLGLVAFTVDVHAAQWGTLSRLCATVDAGRATYGIAIDEHTSVTAAAGAVEPATVRGTGRAWRVVVHDDGVAVAAIWPHRD
ncbi:Type 1 glutamine amidotransferase-like domain-containing protein [Microbacterium sp. NPDC091313]